MRLLLGSREEESLTVYTDGFRVYDPLDKDEDYHRESVIHGDGEYVDGDAHVNSCESHASLARGSRRIEASQKTNWLRISDRSNFDDVFSENRVEKRSKRLFRQFSDSPTTYFARALPNSEDWVV
ncbi:hypothetical protein GCM10009067_34040 [Haloarcula sebkhae]|uniref:ISXO2-like transposase domain-containing protein n=1 Tax=Haloarcula sebkhae TaxID=932660 RepID=A0A830EPW0_9EURY|nr:hypothetical protein GCM10009067_34040 [Haloarcula sebkhae]